MAILMVLDGGRVSVQKQEDVGEFPGFSQLRGNEGRGRAQPAASAFLLFLPASAGLAGDAAPSCSASWCKSLALKGLSGTEH